MKEPKLIPLLFIILAGIFAGIWLKNLYAGATVYFILISLYAIYSVE